MVSSSVIFLTLLVFPFFPPSCDHQYANIRLLIIDAEGNLWPFFAFTVTSIATLPLTYVLARSWLNDPFKQFTRIQTDYKPKHGEIVESQKAKEHNRGRRRWGLMLFVLVGWAIMVYTAYLIYYVEVPVEKRIWNPYDILGISEVCAAALSPIVSNTILTMFLSVTVCSRKAHQAHLQKALPQVPPRQDQARPIQERDR